MAPESPALPVQRGLYGLLTGDAALTDLLAGDGVYDGVPEDAPKPYVTIDESQETPANDHGEFGSQIVQTFRVWTESRGHAPGLSIEAELRRLLDHQVAALDPLVDGHRVVAVRFEYRQALIDPQAPGEIRHMMARYRITTAQEQEE